MAKSLFSYVIFEDYFDDITDFRSNDWPQETKMIWFFLFTCKVAACVSTLRKSLLDKFLQSSWHLGRRKRLSRWANRKKNTHTQVNRQVQTAWPNPQVWFRKTAAAPSFTDELDTEKGENRRLNQFGSVVKFGAARNVKLGRHCHIIQHWGDCWFAQRIFSCAETNEQMKII